MTLECNILLGGKCMQLSEVRVLGEKIRNGMASVIVGKEHILESMVIALFCGGHILLEDVPGVGKTLMARCMAQSLGCSFKRIQFTPDLLPSDLTGIHFFNQKSGEFVFRPGTIFTHILLADEINRATPRTQSSLLECMEERQVTVDGETHKLENPFMVIATQNPVETAGTFPLPEAQLDRFFMRLRPGYPTAAEGRMILDRFGESSPVDHLACAAGQKEILEAQKAISGIKVGAAIKEYIISLVEATRSHDKIILGVSPRGSLALMRASQVYALLRGREFVLPDDVKAVALQVLAHRILLKGHAISQQAAAAEGVLSELLRKLPVPLEEV